MTKTHTHSFVLINILYSVCVWQAYNAGEKQQHLKCSDPGAREGTLLEAEWLKGYGTIKTHGRSLCSMYVLLAP